MGAAGNLEKFEGGRIVRVGGLQRKLLLEALFSTGVCWRYWVTKYSRLKGGVYVIISSFQWSCRAETFHGRWCQSSLLLLVDISWHAEMWVFHNFSMLFHVTSYIFIWFGGWFIVFMATSQNWGCLKNSPKNGFIGSLSSCQGSLSTAYDASRCTKKPEKSTISIYFFMVGTWELPTEPPKKDTVIVVKWSEFLSFSCNDDDFLWDGNLFFFSTPTKLYNTGIPVVFFRIALSWGFRECLKDFHKLWDRRLSNLTNFDEDVLYFSMDFLPTTRVVIVFSDGKNIFQSPF